MPDSAPPFLRKHGANCFQCRFFAVSWNPRLPYMCELMGFKSRVLPAIEVLRVDGIACQGFMPKVQTGQAQPSAAPVPDPSAPPNTPAQTQPAPERGRVSTFRRYA